MLGKAAEQICSLVKILQKNKSQLGERNFLYLKITYILLIYLELNQHTNEPLFIFYFYFF